MKTIVYAHPYEGSYNHAILTKLTDTFIAQNEPFRVIDLYGDNFNPAYTKQELRLFSQGKSLDPLVKKYQKLIKDSDELIFIFPIWWHDVPAIVKGFFDKTMLSGFAYNENSNGWQGLLTNIKHVTVITTATLTKQQLIQESGNAIQSTLLDTTINALGIDSKQTRWIHFGEANITTDAARQEFLQELPKIYNGTSNYVEQ